MKKQILNFVTLVVVVPFFWSCDGDEIVHGNIHGSGHVIDVNYTFTGFTRLDVSHAFKVTIIPSDVYFVKLSVDDNIAGHLDVSQNGSWLVIGLDENHDYSDMTLEAEIHMPDISEFNGSGAVVAEMEAFDASGDVRISLSGASVFAGTLNCQDLKVGLSGASITTLNGTGVNLQIDASGASILNLGNFICQNGDIMLSGASVATIHVNGSLDAELSGASILNYYGNPTLGNIIITGASAINKV